MVENGAYDSARIGGRSGARGAGRLGLVAGVVALATLLGGCSLHWPWHRNGCEIPSWSICRVRVAREVSR
jgi:hypothetical protein